MEEAAARPRVLVVEDESLLAMTLEMTLADGGYDVVGPVGSLEAALEAAREEAFDVALLDVNLDGSKVFPVADLLAERGIPFVFLTGYDAEVLPPRHVAARILCKPVLGSVLRCALKGLGAKPR